MDKEISTKNMKRVVCLHCGHEQYPFYTEDAICRGIFLKCKNPSCRKQFELRL